MKKSLRLVFLNSEGKKHSITIPEIKDQVTSVEIKTLSNVILNSNIFGNELVSLTKAMEAELVSKDTATYKF